MAASYGCLQNLELKGNDEFQSQREAVGKLPETSCILTSRMGKGGDGRSHVSSESTLAMHSTAASVISARTF